ncbi:Bud-site selection protein [Boeremia exigua]|uniref:Bud-site selection protein n=1 Tax=Boeremia exigua TaxID=749465 RepID=UPI001E8E58D7|nr:Bud-site selection protein [Boeremia exigua]KAH6629177.1 Bud-site selection protein [Boeremia exigua]
MAKRKRTSTSPELSTTTPAAQKLLKHQTRALTARLAAAQKPLVAALRLAATFERQKHSRRKKTAVQKRDNAALTRLDDEYRVLKGLDFEAVAKEYVGRTVGRVRCLRECAALAGVVEGIGGEKEKEKEKGGVDAARLNVLARLYKVQAVKKEMDALIEDLKEIVGAGKAEVVVPDVRQGEKKRRAVEVADVDEVVDVDMMDVSDEDGVAARLFNARIAAPSSGEESSGELSDQERPPSVEDSESDSGSFGGFSDADSDSDAAISRSVAPPSDSDDSDSSSSPALASAKSRPTKEAAKPTTSTFLPGLSHANYVSGDESASDLDEKPRKNRRGQRARQKLAELKFGAKAKHIEKNEQKNGWDAKRGAVGSDAKPGNRKDRRAAMKASGGRGPVISGENAAPLGNKRIEGAAAKPAPKPAPKPKKDDTGPLHPSWAAAKAAKESKKLKIDLGGAKSAKKITFD